MKHALLGLVSVLSLMGISKAHADNSSQVYHKFCEPMIVDSDRRECLAVVKASVEFENDALELCANMAINKKKIDCLGYIGDKLYQDFEVLACKQEMLEDNKMACLQMNGRMGLTAPCRVDKYFVAEFEEIRKLMVPQTLASATTNLDKMLGGMRKCY